MLRRMILASLLLIPGVASASEFDGLASDAVWTTKNPADDANSNVRTFRHFTSGTLDVRLETSSGSCSTNIAVPSGATEISHPSMTADGWLFVAARVSSAWHVYRAQNTSFATTPCSGWGAWTQFSDPYSTAPTSAPIATSVSGTYNYIFVTDASGYIDYWYNTQGTTTWTVGYVTTAVPNARSEIAVRYTNSSYHVNLFWHHDTNRSTIDHLAGTVNLFTGAITWPTDNSSDCNYGACIEGRAFRDSATYYMGTACALGASEVGQPNGVTMYIACRDGVTSGSPYYVTEYTSGGYMGWSTATYTWTQINGSIGNAGTNSIPLFGYRTHYNNDSYQSAFISAQTCTGSPCIPVYRYLDRSDLSRASAPGYGPSATNWTAVDTNLDN